VRDEKLAPSLSELMGEGYEHRTELSLEDLPKLLGDKMPSISYDRVGKLRLVNALHQRFGPGYNNLPHVKQIMAHFEKEMHAETVVRMNRRRS
jgi:hypothetical protein